MFRVFMCLVTLNLNLLFDSIITDILQIAITHVLWYKTCTHTAVYHKALSIVNLSLLTCLCSLKRSLHKTGKFGSNFFYIKHICTSASIPFSPFQSTLFSFQKSPSIKSYTGDWPDLLLTLLAHILQK